MNSTTLRGVFPEPRPVHKRNFIKENVKHIKEMQGLLQTGLVESKPAREDRFRNKPVFKAPLSFSGSNKSQQTLDSFVPQLHSVATSKPQKGSKKKIFDKDRGKGEPGKHTMPEEPVEKHFNKGVQTEREENIDKIFDSGTIKYPSAAILKTLAAKKSLNKKEHSFEHGRGDTGGIVVQNPHNEDLSEDMQTLAINDKHNFIKENMLALKHRLPKQELTQDPMKIRNYQKGVVPKYLRDRKEEQKREAEVDPECPEGHVLLPEEERRETLRVLRQSYADRIQELNSMPVRNDTLRMRKRKMAIEEELKKIDEGIKVFQRPKVFVKINA